jgi:hypothetical protein
MAKTNSDSLFPVSDWLEASGIYFYTLKAGDFDTQATQPKDFVATRRMVILK